MTSHFCQPEREKLDSFADIQNNQIRLLKLAIKKGLSRT